MIAGGKPFADIPASFLNVADGEVDQICGGLLGREGAPHLERFAQ